MQQPVVPSVMTKRVPDPQRAVCQTLDYVYFPLFVCEYISRNFFITKSKFEFVVIGFSEKRDALHIPFSPVFEYWRAIFWWKFADYILEDYGMFFCACRSITWFYCCALTMRNIEDICKVFCSRYFVLIVCQLLVAV